MLYIFKHIILPAALMIIFCILSVVVFTQPALHPLFNISNENNIGDAIGGMTGPIIGLVSAILLYLTLNKQIESIKDQKLKNESDIIFLLINQLTTQIDNFSHKYKENKVETKLIGLDGLNDFSTRFRYEYDIHSFDFTFKAFFEANKIRLIIRSYKIIEERIKTSPISKELTGLFSLNLQSIFETMLFDPLENIVVAIDNNMHMDDEISQEIRIFLNAHKQDVNVPNISDDQL